MKPKLLLVVGLAIGYVLGARAGRERYDALAAKANEVWRNPRVVRARTDATQYAKQQAPVIRARAEAVAKDVADRTATAATAARDAAGKAGATAKDVAGKATTVARDTAGKATTAARKTADRTVAAAAQTATRVGEARDQALANLDDIGDLDDDEN